MTETGTKGTKTLPGFDSWLDANMVEIEWAAGRAAEAAGWAAGTAGHKAMCDLIRLELKKPSFGALVWPVK